MALFYRNERWERIVHLTHLISTIALFYTGASWYFPFLADLIGGYQNVMFIHRIAAVIFIIVPLYMIFTKWNKVVHFIKELTHWTIDDTRWMLKFPIYFFKYENIKEMPDFEGKFNPGQKLTGSLQVGLCILIASTGLAWIFLPRLEMEVTPAVFEFLGMAHLLSAVLIFLILIGHIYLGAGIFKPYRGMHRTMFFDGYIEKEKAYKIWPKWAADQEQKQALQKSDDILENGGVKEGEHVEET